MEDRNEKLIPLTREMPGRLSVVQITGLSPKTVRSFQHRGLSAVKVGGTLFTTQEALDEFLRLKKLQPKGSKSAERAVASLRRLLDTL